MELCVELSYSTMLDDAKLDEIAAQGVTAISAPFDFVESSPVDVLKNRAAALASRGIKTLTAHPRFGLYNSDNSLVNQYVSQRKFYIEQLKDGFERMAILGVKTAPLHTGGSCLPDSPEWALELCAESVAGVLPLAEKTGIIIALENTFFNSPQRWDGGIGISGRPPETSEAVYDDIRKLCRLIDGFSSPYVMGCYDVGHAHYLGDVVADHKMMGDRIYLYHLHDNNTARDSHMPPGYGTLDWDVFGDVITANSSEYVAYIEAAPWTPGKYGLMIRETAALLSGRNASCDDATIGARVNEYRRCKKCGHLILTDADDEFCGC